MKYIVNRRSVYVDGHFDVDFKETVDKFSTLKEAQRFMRKCLLDDAVLHHLAPHDERFKNCLRFDDVKDHFESGRQLLDYLQSQGLIVVTMDRIKCSIAPKTLSGNVTEQLIELTID